MTTNELLFFLNYADLDMLMELQFHSGNLTKETTSIIIKSREKKQIETTDELKKIINISDKEWDLWMQNLNIDDSLIDYITSNELFIFSSTPKISKKYSELVKLKKVNYYDNIKLSEKNESKIVLEKNHQTYELLYKINFDITQFTNELKNATNFLNTIQNEVFAIQIRNNYFLCGSVPSHSTFAKKLPFIQKFRVSHQFNNSHQIPIQNSFQNQWPCINKTVVFETDFFGSIGYLSFDYQRQVVKIIQKPSDNRITANELFDVNGILNPPNWAYNGLYRHFNMMNWLQSRLPLTDPRQFVMGETQVNTNVSGNNNVLRGSNNNHAFWNPDFEFRFIEILENVKIQIKPNQTSGVLNRYFSFSTNTNSLVAVDKTINQLQNSELFSIYVFYGKWNDRKSNVTKIAIKSKVGGFVSIKENTLGIKEDLGNLNYITLNDKNPIPEEYLFIVENGWGNSVDDIVLKSKDNKYISNWQNIVIAEKHLALQECQLKIIRP